MNRALTAIRRLNQAMSILAACLCIAMALLGLGIVVLRYGFSVGSIAAQELVLYCHAFVFLAAAAATLDADGHVRVDIFYRRWSGPRRGLVDLLGTLLLLLPVMGFILFVSWGYVADAWARHEVSSEAGGLPWVYLLKSLILLFAGQMLLQGLVQGVQAYRAWREA